MESIALSCKRREGRGKEAARKLRNDGLMPAVVYGHGFGEPIPVSLDPKALQKALENPWGQNALFEIEIDGEAKGKVLVRELQRHPVSRAVLHIDLVAPDLQREIVAAVPVRFTGKSIGVSAGGRIRKPYREVKLRATPDNIPAEIVLDITNLDHGDAIMASELDLPENVVPVFDRDYVVVKVVKPRGRAAKPGEEEAKQPE